MCKTWVSTKGIHESAKEIQAGRSYRYTTTKESIPVVGFVNLKQSVKNVPLIVMEGSNRSMNEPVDGAGPIVAVHGKIN